MHNETEPVGPRVPMKSKGHDRVCCRSGVEVEFHEILPQELQGRKPSLMTTWVIQILLRT